MAPLTTDPKKQTRRQSSSSNKENAPPSDTTNTSPLGNPSSASPPSQNLSRQPSVEALMPPPSAPVRRSSRIQALGPLRQPTQRPSSLGTSALKEPSVPTYSQRGAKPSLPPRTPTASLTPSTTSAVPSSTVPSNPSSIVPANSFTAAPPPPRHPSFLLTTQTGLHRPPAPLPLSSLGTRTVTRPPPSRSALLTPDSSFASAAGATGPPGMSPFAFHFGAARAAALQRGVPGRGTGRVAEAPERLRDPLELGRVPGEDGGSGDEEGDEEW